MSEAGCPLRSGTAPETSRPTEKRGVLAQLLAHLATKADTGMGLAAKLELLPRRGRSQARTACSPPSRGPFHWGPPGTVPGGSCGPAGPSTLWSKISLVFSFEFEERLAELPSKISKNRLFIWLWISIFKKHYSSSSKSHIITNSLSKADMQMLYAFQTFMKTQKDIQICSQTGIRVRGFTPDIENKLTITKGERGCCCCCC